MISTLGRLGSQKQVRSRTLTPPVPNSYHLILGPASLRVPLAPHFIEAARCAVKWVQRGKSPPANAQRKDRHGVQPQALVIVIIE